MSKPMPRTHPSSPFMLRPELLETVPHSMATIDRLEAAGKFPKRVRLEPTNRVAWPRRQVRGYVRQLFRHRQPTTPEDKSSIAPTSDG
jgi:predicted DNA-binding transcriptional regulator AlpA